jgi:Flp pilus assembly protein TadG
VSRRRWPGRDRGSFTAELAAGLPALILLLMVGLTAVRAVSDQMQCLDAAREGARAASRGDPGTPAASRVAPDGADVHIVTGAESVTVTVSAPVRLVGGGLSIITVQGSAVAAREPEAIGAIP